MPSAMAPSAVGHGGEPGLLGGRGMWHGPGEQHRRRQRDGTGREPTRAESQHGQGASTGGSGTAWPSGKGAAPPAPGHGAARPPRPPKVATEGRARTELPGSAAQAAPGSREGSAAAPSGAGCWANTALGALCDRAKLPALWGDACGCCLHRRATSAAATCTAGQRPPLLPAPRGQCCCLLPAPRARCPRHPARTMPAARTAGQCPLPLLPGQSPPALPAPRGRCTRWLLAPTPPRAAPHLMRAEAGCRDPGTAPVLPHRWCHSQPGPTHSRSRDHKLPSCGNQGCPHSREVPGPGLSHPVPHMPPRPSTAPWARGLCRAPAVEQSQVLSRGRRGGHRAPQPCPRAGGCPGVLPRGPAQGTPMAGEGMEPRPRLPGWGHHQPATAPSSSLCRGRHLGTGQSRNSHSRELRSSGRAWGSPTARGSSGPQPRVP